MKKTLKRSLVLAMAVITVFSLVACRSSASYDYYTDYEIIKTLSVRMPSEYEESSMIMMCYPNMMPMSAYKAIAEDNEILVLVNYGLDGEGNPVSRMEEAIRVFTDEGVNMDHVTFLDMEIDGDYQNWARDFSPFYVFYDYELSIVDFTYNRPWRVGQNDVPEQLADYFDMPYYKMDIVHTGGNLMQDGRGTAFSDDLVIAENDRDWDKVLDSMKEYTGTDNYVVTIDPQG
ncbi:MAG: agmatine deiminase family protein, partial [Clostridia bacterium]|nr:agmatine deiminase family protein [Clostridia bacterium]